MSKTRLDKIDAAIRALQRRVTVEQTANTGLPLEWRTVHPFKTKLSMYQMTAEEALVVKDQLLGLGGATVIANGRPIEGWLTEAEERELDQELIDAGFLRGDDGRWVMPTPEAEIAFLRAWLSEADATGRRVHGREAIEGWISYLGDSAKVVAPVTINTTVEPLPGLQERILSADEAWAKQKHRRESEAGQTYTMADRQAALDRRRNRLNQ